MNACCENFPNVVSPEQLQGNLAHPRIWFKRGHHCCNKQQQLCIISKIIHTRKGRRKCNFIVRSGCVSYFLFSFLYLKTVWKRTDCKQPVSFVIGSLFSFTNLLFAMKYDSYITTHSPRFWNFYSWKLVICLVCILLVIKGAYR